MAVHKSQVTYDGSASSGTAYGMTILGGIMMCIVGVFQILQGIVGLAKDDIYVRGLNYTYQFDTSAWGTIHLVVGVVALITGIAVVLGKTWGYIVGVVIAGLSALTNFTFIPIYPVWSIIVLGFDVLIIWALCHQLRTEG